MLALRRRPIQATGPDKQLFGGKLPGFIERIVQRIQNYFSVYNPPEYFEGSGPATAYNDTSVTVICSNDVQNDSLSCDPIDTESDYTQECEQNATDEQTVLSHTSGVEVATAEDGYNIVLTHTVVHDNTINVYSPADVSSQVMSNVVVILEPSADEYSPPRTEPPRNKDKFYVYVNPTAANKKKQNGQQSGNNQVETYAESEERPESFQPYSNATYTVIIKGEKLQEFANNLENADNNALNPEISIYSESSMSVKPVAGRCRFGSGSAPECEPKSSRLGDTIGPQLTSRSVAQSRSQVPDETDVPNINLVLIPPSSLLDDRTNRSCTKNQFNDSDIKQYYFILKPDNGSLSRPRPKPKDVAPKTEINYPQKKPTLGDAAATSATYLPPVAVRQTKVSDEEDHELSVVASNATTQIRTKSPLLLNLFTRSKPEETAINKK